MAVISLYPDIRTVKNGTDLSVDLFLEYIESGKWQDIVLPIRTMDKAGRTEAKKKVPYVTLSGLFTDRTDAGIKEHSGFIGIDIDEVDAEETKSILAPDPHVYAIFTSISGKGVCALFRINGEKHREAFAGISEYLYEKYNVICDPTSVNPSRPRFISYDPGLWINTKAARFTQYPKDKGPKKVEKIVFAKNDFEDILQDISRRNISLCDNYSDWLRIAFSLCDKFGEGGRSYFHVISSPSPKYSAKDADRQYTNCLKARGSKIATIATFYWYCKQAGIATYSQTTKTVLTAAVNAKKGSRKPEGVVKLMEDFEGIPAEVSREIIDQVYENNIEYVEEGLIIQLEQWLRYNHSIRRNAITRHFENGGRIMTGTDFNTVFIEAKKIMDKANFETVERLINSSFTPQYNPFLDFIRENEARTPTGCIEAVIGTIQTPNPEYAQRFARKWLVSIIAAIHGQHSPLMLILSGTEHGTGKTEWFRRLLPEAMQPYFGDISSGMKDTDLNILMTQKLLLLDDECGGKSKKDEIALKSMLSKQVFSLREPYGRNNVDLIRLAVLCGTTNEESILHDPTGNRRILPIPVQSIDHREYNAIDKTDLFIEAYQLWKSGFNWQLTRDDIAALGDGSTQFESHSAEYELLQKYYQRPEQGGYVDHLTATDIKVQIERMTQQKLVLERIGKEMQRIGYKQISKRIDGNPKKVYPVVCINQVAGSGYSPITTPESATSMDNPF